MNYPNIIQASVDSFCKGNGMSKHGGSWYQNSDGLITVVELQKSNFGVRYFLIIAVWLTAIEPARFPKEHECHIRTRFGHIVPDSKALDALLDLGHDLGDESRQVSLRELLDAYLSPLLTATQSVAGL